MREYSDRGDRGDSSDRGDRGDSSDRGDRGDICSKQERRVKRKGNKTDSDVIMM